MVQTTLLCMHSAALSLLRVTRVRVSSGPPEGIQVLAVVTSLHTSLSEPRLGPYRLMNSSDIQLWVMLEDQCFSPVEHVLQEGGDRL